MVSAGHNLRLDYPRRGKPVSPCIRAIRLIVVNRMADKNPSMATTRRSSETTQAIRNAAMNLLVTEGPLGFTMEKLASRARISIGSVYARYHDRDAAWRDIVEHTVLPGVHALIESLKGETLQTQLGSVRMRDGVDTELSGLVMLAMATRTAAFEEPKVLEALSAITGVLSLGQSDRRLESGIRTSLLAWLIGVRFLEMAGCEVPRVEESFSFLVEDMLHTSSSERIRHRALTGVVSWQPPSTPVPRVNDEIAEKLASATRRSAALRGVANSSVHDIAADSGLTTGAIYRRYESKRVLLLDAMMRELNPERYAWTQRFLVALLDESSHTHPGDVLVDQMLSLIEDPITLGSQIELIAAALVDKSMRDVLLEQFTKAAQSRENLFDDLKGHGVLRPGTDPELLAWVLQAVPLGARILQSTGMRLDEDELRLTFRRLIDVV